MSFWGCLVLFTTGFLWSWGAEISKKIEVFEYYHRSPFTFWGAYHRFNKFFLQVSDYPNLMQASLGALFFLPIIMFTQTWLLWLMIIFGGGTYVFIQNIFSSK